MHINELYRQYIYSKISKCKGRVYKLKNIFDFGKGLNITKENLGNKGIRCINYGEIHNINYFSFCSKGDNLKGLNSDLDIKINEFSKLKKGDFIFCDTSEDLEDCGNFSYKTDEELSYAGYHTIVAKPQININSKFLAFCLDSDIWKDSIREKVNGIKSL